MPRYGETKKVKKNNKDYYGTTIYDEIPKKNTDMYFIAQYGDRCDTLALRFYNSVDFWWVIAKANNLKTMNIPAGTSLRIPVSTTNIKGS